MSDCGQSLRLLQALNDENQDIINDCIKHASVKQWINDNVSVKLITNPRIKFVDDFVSITCLCYASRYSTPGVMQQLVQAGADVTVTDSWQQTPLHWACASDFDIKDRVEYLLGCDASLFKARSKYNNTVERRLSHSSITDTNKCRFSAKICIFSRIFSLYVMKT